MFYLLYTTVYKSTATRVEEYTVLDCLSAFIAKTLHILYDIMPETSHKDVINDTNTNIQEYALN